MTKVYESWSYFTEEMKTRLTKFRNQNIKIEHLFDRGKIDGAHKEYAQCLVALDFALWQIQGVGQFDGHDKLKRYCMQRISDAQMTLDCMVELARKLNNPRIYNAACDRYEATLNMLTNTHRGGLN